MRAWILAFRPKTLTAAIIPIFVGTSLVHLLGFPVHWWISGVALLASLFIQIGTNLVNDAIDFKKGADTAERIGPQRVTQSGLISSQKVMLSAAVAFLIALLLGIPLVVEGGWPILIIGLASLVCAYGYTGGPYPLAYRGLGDLFVILFFGVVAVGGLSYLHLHFWPWESLALGVQVGSLAAVLIAINNLRDHEGDRKVHKKTFAVRWGVRAARWEIASLSFMPFAVNLTWLFQSRWAMGFLPWFCAPIAVSLVKNIFRHEPGPLYNRFLAQAAALHSIFGVLLSFGMWFS